MSYTSTQVVDSAGRGWTYAYDAAGQLRVVQAPADGGQIAVTHYAYDAVGHLSQVTDAMGGITTYSYDANGDLLQVIQGKERVDREYNAAGQVVSETRYPQLDDNGNTVTTVAETKRYVYDASNRLRFAVDAAGDVTEYRYATVGASGVQQLSLTLTYLGGGYDLTGLMPTQALTESQLASWVSGQDMGQITRVDFSYDVRGALAERRAYATVDANGVGVVDAGLEIVRYSYDAQGLLCQQIEVRGANRDQLEGTSFVYDGMGRLTSTTDALNHTTTRLYDDANHRLVVTQANGLIQTQVYDQAGQVITATESAASTSEVHTSHWFYDAEGQLRATEDASGARTYHFYDGGGNLQADVDATGSVVEYRYNYKGQVFTSVAYATRVDTTGWLIDGQVSVSDFTQIQPVGTDDDRYTEYGYDASGRLTQTLQAFTALWSFSWYDGAGRLASSGAIDSRGTASESGAFRISRMFYDAAGRQIASLDPAGYLTEFSYDRGGRQIGSVRYATATDQALRGDGTLDQLRPAGNVAADVRTRMFYDGRGNVIATLDAEGYLTESSIDETGHARETRAYALRLTGLTGDESLATLHGMVASGAVRTNRMAYDAMGQLVTQTNAEGTVTTYSYDVMGRLVRTDTAAGASEVRENNQRYDVFGNLIGELGGEGSIHLLPGMTEAQLNAIYNQYGVTHRYDVLGRRIESSDANGNKTWYVYDAAGRQTFRVRGVADTNGVPNGAGEVTETRYNAFGQVQDSIAYSGRITITMPGDRASVLLAINTLQYAPTSDNHQQFTYDTRGLLASRLDANGYLTNYYYNSFGALRSKTEFRDLAQTQSETTVLAYDSLGRLISTTESSTGIDAQIRTSTQTWDAFNRISMTDARGTVADFTYDRLGRQVTSSSTVSGRLEQARLVYDAYGRVTNQLDAANNETTFIYNDIEKSIAVTSPEGVTVKTIHDALGQTISVTNGLNETTTYTYDHDGHLAGTMDAAGATTSNEYDARGLLHRTIDATGRVVELNYDAAGRVLTRVVDPNGLALTTAYAYDGQGRQIQVTDPSGVVTAMTYDLAGQLIETTVDPLGLALKTDYTWDGLGRQLTVTEGAGTTAVHAVAYAYDGLGRRISETVDPNGLALTTTYVYDENDNVTSRTDAAGRVTAYAYDEANRLIQTIDGDNGVTRMTYDVKGQLIATRQYTNRMQVDGTLVADDARDVQSYRVYDEDGRVRYTVDGDGAVCEYTYDAANRLAQTRHYATVIDINAVRADLQVGNLAPTAVADDAHDEVTSLVYDAVGRVRFTVDAAGGVTESNYDAAGRAIGTVAYTVAIDLSDVVLRDRFKAGMVAASEFHSVYDDQSGELLTQGLLSDESGIQSSNYYDGAGRKELMLRNDGTGTRIRYDAASRVVETIEYAYPDTGWVSFDTDAPTFPPYLLDPQDRATTNIYDTAGRLEFVLTRQSPKPVVQDPNQNFGGEGSPENEYGNAQARIEQFVRDASGNVIRDIKYAKTIDYKIYIETEESTFEQDYSRTDFDTAFVEINNGESRQTRSVYDAAGREIYAIDAMGDVAETVYDSSGRVTATRAYDLTVGSTANDAAQIQQALSGAGSRATQYAYDDAGRLISTTDALGHQESTQYDGVGQVIARTNKNGDVWTYGYDAAGRKTSEITPEIRISTAQSDGTTISVTRAIESRYAYDALGNLVSRIEDFGYSARQTDYEYDNRGHQTATIYADPGEQDPVTGQIVPTGSRPTIRVTYDTLGRAVAQCDMRGHYSFKTYDNLGRLAADIDAEGGVSRYEYNAFGERVVLRRFTQLIALPMDASEASLQQLQGAVDSAQWWNARSILTEYDCEGRVVYTGNGNTDKSTESTYNTYGDLVETAVFQAGVASNNGGGGGEGGYSSGIDIPDRYARTVYYRDANGRETLSIDPEGYATTSEYDAYGNLTRRVEYAKTLHVFNDFDPNSLGYQVRPEFASRANSPGNATMADAYRFNPDQRPDLPPAGDEANGFDRVSTYTYDALNRRISETQSRHIRNPADGTFAAGQIVTTTGYDAEGRVIALDTVNGHTQTHYDALGRVVDVIEPERQVLRSNAEQLLASDQSIDLASAQLYEAASPVTEMLYDSFGDTIQVHRYANGLQQGESTPVASSSDQTQSFGYDALGRQLWSRDAAGNIINKSFDAAGNVLTTRFALHNATAAPVMVVMTSAYDACGRQVRTETAREWLADGVFQHEVDSGSQVRYNAFGEIALRDTRTDPGLADWDFAIYYNYDRDGNLVETNEKGFTQNFTYDSMGNLVGDDKNSYVYDRKGGLIAVVGQEESSSEVWVAPKITLSHTDRWGNTLFVEDSRGARTDYRYNELNQLEKEIQPYVRILHQDGTEVFDRPERTVYHDLQGREIAQKDPNGNLRRNIVDSAGNVVETKDGRGYSTRFAYDLFGRTLYKQDANGHISISKYNLNDQLVEQGDFAAGVGQLRVENMQAGYTLNELGNRIRVQDALGGIQQYDYDSRGLVIRSQTAAGVVMSYAYDTLGNKIRETNALSDPGLLTAGAPRYDGGIIEQQDAIAGQTYTYILPADAFSAPQGRTISIAATIEVDDGRGGSKPSTDLQWDAVTRTLSGTPAANVQYRVTFTATTDASQVAATGYLVVSGVTQQDYDTRNAASPAIAHAFNVQRPEPGTAFSYTIPADAFTHPLGKTLTYKAYIRYTQATMDPDTREESLEEINAEIGLTPAAGGWLSFDPTTRILSGTVPAIDGAAEVVIVAIDPDGNTREQSLVIDPPNPDIQNGRRTTVDSNGQTVYLDEQTWNYNEFGQLVEHHDLSGVRYDYQYDWKGRLQRESNDWTQTIASTSMQVQTRRSGGFLKKLFGGSKKKVYVPVTTYTSYAANRYRDYDTQGRLTFLSDGNGSYYQYVYDEVGNRIRETSNTMDGSGQRIHLETRMEYDFLNRLTHVVQEDMDKQKRLLDVRYSYDAAGNRVRVQYSDGYGRFGAAATDTSNNAPIVNFGVPAANDWSDSVLPPAIYGQAYAYTLPANFVTDPDGDPLAFDVTTSASWLTYNKLTHTLEGMPPSDSMGQRESISVKVKAIDWNGAVTSKTATIALCDDAIDVADWPPGDVWLKASTNPGDYGNSVYANSFFWYDERLPTTLSIEMADGSQLPAWLQVHDVVEYGGVRHQILVDSTKLPDVVGTVRLKLTLAGTNGHSATVEADFHVNRPPRWNGPAAVQLVSGQPWSMQFTPDMISDVDDDVSTGNWQIYFDRSLPYWLTYDAATKTLSGTPPTTSSGMYGFADNQVPLVFWIYNGQGGQSREIGLLLDYKAQDKVSAVKTVPLQQVEAGQAFELTLPTDLFAGRDGVAMTYTASRALVSYTPRQYDYYYSTDPQLTRIGTLGLPAWLNFDSQTLKFSGTAPNVTGHFIVEVKATDANGQSATKLIQISVLPTGAQMHQMVGDGIDVTALLATTAYGDGYRDPNDIQGPGLARLDTGIPPHLAQELTINFAAGHPIAYTLPSWMVVGDNVEVIALSLTSGIQYDTATRTFSGSPPSNYGYAKLALVDASGRYSFCSINFSQSGTPTAEAGGAIGDAQAQVGEHFDLTIPATALPGTGSYYMAIAQKSNGQSAKYGWYTTGDNWDPQYYNGYQPVSTDPANALSSYGFSYDPVTGAIQGCPSEAGVYEVRVYRGGVASTFAIRVDRGIYPNPRLNTTLPNMRVRVGEAWSYTLPADWAMTDNGESVMLDTTTLPAWVTYDAATRTFSGTPGDSDQYSSILLMLKTASGAQTAVRLPLEVYEIYAPEPENAGMYNGDIGWNKSTGFTIEENSFGNYVAMLRGGKRFDVTNNDWGVVKPGVSITAQCNVTFRTTNGNESAQVLLKFYNAQGQLISRVLGSEIKAPSTGGTSTITATAPADAAYVEIGATAYSSNQYWAPAHNEHPVWLSGFSWKYPDQTVGVASGTAGMTTAWYAYDANNQVSVANGDLVNGQIVLKAASDSQAYDYDAAGNLVRQRFLENGVQRAQDFTYDLRSQKIAQSQTYAVGDAVGAIGEGWTYDDAGRVIRHRTYDASGLKHLDATTYDLDGRQLQQDSFGRSLDGTGYNEEAIGEGLARLAKVDFGAYGYDVAGRLGGYVYTAYRHEADSGAQTSDPIGYSMYYRESYQGRNSYLETRVDGVSTNPNFRATFTTSEYDGWGQRTVIREQTPKFDKRDQLDDRVRYFAYDGEGDLLRRIQGTVSLGGTFNQSADERNYTETYAYANGQHIATGKANGGSEVLPQLTGYVSSDAGSGEIEVMQGDTLQSVSQRMYGSANYWYVLAEANGLSPSEALTPGTRLKVPSVHVSANDATAFEPFSPNDAIGNTAPNLPYITPPKKKHCNALATILIIVVAVVVTIYTAGVAAGWMGAAAASSGSTMAVGTAALAGTYGTTTAVVAGAVGGAAGSIASQAVGSAMGVSEFSWKNVAVAAVAGGLTAGLGSAMQGSSALYNSSAQQFTTLGRVVQGVGSYGATVAANAVMGNHTGFSWKGVAAAAVGAYVSAELGGKLSVLQGGKSQGFWGDLEGGFINGAANASAQRLMGMGKQDWGQIALDAFGNALGNAIVGGIQARQAENRMLDGLTPDQVAIYRDAKDKFGDAGGMTVLGIMKTSRSDVSLDDLRSVTDRALAYGSADFGTYSKDDFMNLTRDRLALMGDENGNPLSQSVIDANMVALQNAHGFAGGVPQVTVDFSNFFDPVQPSPAPAITDDIYAAQDRREQNPVLGFAEADTGAKKVGEVATTIGRAVEANPILKYGLVAIDVASGPWMFAARQGIAQSPIGRWVEEKQEQVVGAVAQKYVDDPGYSETDAKSAATGVFVAGAIILTGASGVLRKLPGVEGMLSRLRSSVGGREAQRGSISFRKIETNRQGLRYPSVIDPRTGVAIPNPGAGLKIVDKELRAPWGATERGAFIKEWYDKGFTTPEGGWAKYDIHHITPREYGGTNDFNNLVPVLRDVHQKQFNPWWSGY
ncbi:putative Ig domain-containing protein [Solilutibacter silvestris]|uniref:putative Ig domain-containing protein n=1 Tax=Solilutibacter silvestris TaxID=1645665 RepID=UPI003D350666